MTPLGDNGNVTPGLFKSCEAGLCELYGYPQCREVNQVRYDMLSKGSESHQIPTQDALKLHIRRANYQMMLWKHALGGQYQPPIANGHGWVKNGDSLDIVWMLEDPVPKSLLELVRCKTCKSVIPVRVHARKTK